MQFYSEVRMGRKVWNIVSMRKVDRGEKKGGEVERAREGEGKGQEK